MGYIETGDKTSVDVLTWVVLHSLITYERTREHFLCGQTEFLRMRLGKCHWIVLLNGSNSGAPNGSVPHNICSTEKILLAGN